MPFEPEYRTLGKPNPEAIAAQLRDVAEKDTLRRERDAWRAKCDQLQVKCDALLQEINGLTVDVLTLTAERDEARALGRTC
jgi:hypothetical protein